MNNINMSRVILFQIRGVDGWRALPSAATDRLSFYRLRVSLFHTVFEGRLLERVEVGVLCARWRLLLIRDLYELQRGLGCKWRSDLTRRFVIFYEESFLLGLRYNGGQLVSLTAWTRVPVIYGPTKQGT
jgi:hypothetical protein